MKTIGSCVITRNEDVDRLEFDWGTIRMLSEAVRELGVENQIAVRDLAELLLQSVMIRDEANMTERVDLSVDQEVYHV